MEEVVEESATEADEGKADTESVGSEASEEAEGSAESGVNTQEADK